MAEVFRKVDHHVTPRWPWWRLCMEFYKCILFIILNSFLFAYSAWNDPHIVSCLRSLCVSFSCKFSCLCSKFNLIFRARRILRIWVTAMHKEFVIYCRTNSVIMQLFLNIPIKRKDFFRFTFAKTFFMQMKLLIYLLCSQTWQIRKIKHRWIEYNYIYFMRFYKTKACLILLCSLMV